MAARPLLGHQNVAARRAEEQHRRILAAGPPLPAGMAEAEEELLAHADVLELFQAALARLVQDPLLCDLPPQVGPGAGEGPGALGAAQPRGAARR